MSVPTLQKTWNFNVNDIQTYPYTVDIERGRALLFNIKEHMVGSGKFAVEASSDATSYKNVGDADPDLWIDKDDVNRGSTTRSWIVLYNSTLNISFVIDYQSAADYQGDVYFAPGHYNADGTTDARPTTSANEISWANTSVSLGRGGGSTRQVMHSMWSSDGECFRLFCRSNGSDRGVCAFIIEKPASPADGWTNPIIVDWIGDADDDTWPERSRWYSNLNLYTLVDDTWYQMYATAEVAGDSNTPLTLRTDCNPVELDSSGGYLFMPMGLFGKTIGIRGSNGRFFDCWWGPNEATIGDTFPDDGSREFVKIGDIIWPWDGSLTVME